MITAPPSILQSFSKKKKKTFRGTWLSRSEALPSSSLHLLACKFICLALILSRMSLPTEVSDLYEMSHAYFLKHLLEKDRKVSNF